MICECQRGLHFLHVHVENGLVEDHPRDGVQLGHVLHLLPLGLLVELELVLIVVLPFVLGVLGVQRPTILIPNVSVMDRTAYGDDTGIGSVAIFRSKGIPLSLKFGFCVFRISRNKSRSVFVKGGIDRTSMFWNHCRRGDI